MHYNLMHQLYAGATYPTYLKAKSHTLRRLY